MGVVWGEGPASQRGQAVSADVFSDWIGRLIRAMWRRLFLDGGEA
jgi:hypothetical protein